MPLPLESSRSVIILQNKIKAGTQGVFFLNKGRIVRTPPYQGGARGGYIMVFTKLFSLILTPPAFVPHFFQKVGGYGEAGLISPW